MTHPSKTTPAEEPAETITVSCPSYGHEHPGQPCPAYDTDLLGEADTAPMEA